MKQHVFVSYSSRDQKIADTVVRDLNALGLKVWYDKFEVLVGHDITDEVYKGLMSCDHIAVILTGNSVNSRWVTEELNYAKQRAISENGKRIILPLLFEKCTVPAQIKTLRYADFTQSYRSGFRDLATSLGFGLLEVRESPLRQTLWDRIDDLFNEEYSSELTLKQISEVVEDELGKSRLGVYYTVRNDFDMMEETRKDPTYFVEPDFDDLNTLIYDYNRRQIWLRLYNILEIYHNKPENFQWREEYERFRTEIGRSTFSNIDGVKHEAILVSDLRLAVEIMYRLREF